MKRINPKKKPVNIDRGVVPAAMIVRKTERILSGKINLSLDNLLWTSGELKRLAPESKKLSDALGKYIEKRKGYN